MALYAKPFLDKIFANLIVIINVNGRDFENDRNR